MFIVIGYDLDNLLELTSSTGHHLIYDFNSQLRTDNGCWDSANAQQIIDYLTNDGNNRTPILFQLGNGKWAIVYIIFKSIDYINALVYFIYIYA